MFKKNAKSEAYAKETNQSEAASGDEALFEALAKTKKRKRRKRIRMILFLLVILAVALFMGTRLLQQRVRDQFAASSKEVLSAKAERGTISTVVSGSGMLVNVDTQAVSVPSGVEVTEILVKYSDQVEKGDILATVDMASVRSAMSDLQEQIETLDKEIASAKDETVSSYISAGVSGRLKALYAQKGDLVEDVMVAHGSLAVISLDGYMAVDIDTQGLGKGDSVTVTLADGTQKAGTVDTVLGSKATILVTDNGPEDGEEVTVLSADGQTLGSGTLYIHSPLAITGYAGTINGISTALNQQVYAYSTLFQLTDTSTSASYDALLRSRSELEETLLELLQIQHDNSLTAPISGSVFSVADLDSEDDTEITDIVTLSPDLRMQVTINVDEADILSLELDQQADVSVSSIGEDGLQGVVTEIDKTYSSGNYTAVITLDKKQGMISGMTASVDIRIEGVDDAILIPADALHQTSSGYFVYTSYDEQTQQYGGMVDVIPGLSNSKFVEIKSGLSEADTVYYTEAQSSGNMFGGMGFGGNPGGFSGMPGGSSGFGGGNGGSRGNSGGTRGSNSGGPGGMPGGFGG